MNVLFYGGSLNMVREYIGPDPETGRPPATVMLGAAGQYMLQVHHFPCGNHEPIYVYIPYSDQQRSQGYP